MRAVDIANELGLRSRECQYRDEKSSGEVLYYGNRRGLYLSDRVWETYCRANL